jgi:menaquinol-cytochrome c reductase iron-sulfur subunit
VAQENNTSAIVEQKDGIVMNRRSFFTALLAIGSACMGALLAIPVLRFVLYPLYAKSSGSDWSDVGDISEFSVATAPVRKTVTFAQRDGWREVVSSQAVYVCRDASGQLQALSAICPHLGCSISWQEAQSDFICPCHTSIFKPNGALISGPSPRGMDPLPTRTVNGKLQVHFEYFRPNVPNQEKLS